MTSSYLNEMYDVTGVNVFPRKLMKFPSKKKVNSVPSPLLLAIFRLSGGVVLHIQLWSVP